jgi:Transglutaminase-like superfamily
MTARAAVLFAALLIATPISFAADAPARWWPDEVEQALEKAKDNRAELEKALHATPKDQRKGMEFLIANMPNTDLKSLKADFLLTNNELAYKAKSEVPWGKDIPEAIFLNDVLAYANVDETRDAWRQELYDMCMPIVKGCKTPSEAAQKLNTDVFPKLKLGYSTQRKAPNQSPKESIEQGKASCTGLSIVLSDACRAVCVPARLVGTPLWANKRGNHTWVEIWDRDWHFTGACEQDKNGLDRGWFVGDAAQAQKDSAEHAIYATSFRKSTQHFPMVWARGNKDVPGENVTERYAKKPAAKTATTSVSFRVINGDKKRVAAEVVVTSNDPKERFEGKSRGETADTNDFLSFDLVPEREYVVEVAGVKKTIKTGIAGKPQVIDIVIADK